MLELLKTKRMRNQFILGVGAGIPLTAKIAHDTGADFIVTHKEEMFGADGRMPVIARAGYGGNCNEIIMEQADRYVAAANGTPVFAGVGPAEPYTNVDRFTEKLLEKGVTGVTNYPTAGGWVGSYGNGIQMAGVGYSLEVEYLRRWSRRGAVTLGYCFEPDQVKQMLDAGVDILSLYIPRTENESHGWDDAPSEDKAVEAAIELVETARREDKDRIILCSGATIHEVSDIHKYLEDIKADGYISDESVECVTIDRSVSETVARYRRLNTCM
ncbi:phosphoenolpyruvate hydrolase family protein [Dorea sp. D27]|uniref:phosphoenolpyruvate hydrolase family protein n=1 Tax=Dorea sp. D27 TaxID=658665 RepID=UPI000673C0C2|nr:phosphoenolpyruvate hydrolase family protein [Dorea sp. D27]KMZ53541.1 TIM-barrel signal transduction protein [Dorea sp. D27]